VVRVGSFCALLGGKNLVNTPLKKSFLEEKIFLKVSTPFVGKCSFMKIRL
jgi:hypothetical protein